MVLNAAAPWKPDRRWADPFIAVLLGAILVLVFSGQARARRAAAPASEGASLEWRVRDVALGAAESLGADSIWAPLRTAATPARLAPQARAGWDRALLAVHAAETGDLDTGANLAAAAPGTTFQRAWAWAYRGAGSAPPAADLAAVRRALGGGYAGQVLEARARARSGGDPGPGLAAARAWAIARLRILGAAAAVGFLALAGGVTFGLYLLLTPGPLPALPRYGMSGRAVLLVLLGWFLTLQVAAPAGALLVALAPPLKPAFLPLVYALHASLGTAYLCRAEGVDLPTLWRRAVPGRTARALAAGLGFFALACAVVLGVALVLAPLLPQGPSPQRELMELLSRMRGTWAVLLLFLTVAGLAPTFEELMFRGFLLPWLGERLAAKFGRGSGWFLAIAVTGLSFGIMHLQPLGLPVLTALGVVLGYAFVRTGNLASAILVHALWNGWVFLLVRWF